MAMALPLLPQYNIIQGIQDIATYANEKGLSATVAPFLQYVQRTWVEGGGAQHLSVFGQKRRTNNDQESFHYRMLQKIRRVHPNVWCFTDGLRKMEHAAVQEYETYMSGAAPPQSRPSAYLAQDRRIISASNQLLAGDIVVSEFLHLVCHTIGNVYDPQSGFLGLSDDEQDDDEVAPPPPPPANPLMAPVLVEGDEVAAGERGDQQDPAPAARGRRRQRGRGRGRDEGRGRGRGRVRGRQRGGHQPLAGNEDPAQAHSYCNVCLTHNNDMMVALPCGHISVCSMCLPQLVPHVDEGVRYP
ncbi:uncharacterized protein LOC120349875 isoform X3 [Nilaparvata lugens]|uniref:uncharacterized protein LOC120349875 isoform X3 n=1 Tax=Nilaparvata lugens TaxID=108931 RepID=UPI00193E4C93|nr:uncharacterized protein LOC120349875 isoform X3 [Nilaparvata lugens]